MPKSKEQFPEISTGKFSHCYQADPSKCSLHFHVNGVKLAKALNNSVIIDEDNEGQGISITEYAESGKAHISSIAPLEDFFAAVEARKVNSQTHDEHPYTIFKYTQSTVFEQDWNDVTLAARGLIVNHETGEIVARPFAKFFNHNEGNAPVELMRGEAIVTEKLDGSLGISYLTPDGKLQIASSGSFASEQAQHANEIYAEKYEGKWDANPELTYMWEIIYPENRIVVDYGDEDDIYLLGAVHKATGRSIPASQVSEWQWKKAEEYSSLDNLDKVLKSGERDNREGFILFFPETDARFKVKHQTYVKLHRLATGLNDRAIHEMLATGGTAQLDEFMKTAPEEFTAYIVDTKKKIQGQFDDEKNRIVSSFESFAKSLPADTSQKDFALKVTSEVASSDRPYFFKLRQNGKLDEKSEQNIWDKIKPEFKKGFWASNSQEDE
jgi:RNA ligase